MQEYYFSQNRLTACCTDTTITLFWKTSAMSGSPCWAGTSTTPMYGTLARPLS